MRSQQQRIIATVAYSDIFDFPLTRDEVYTWGVGGVSRTFFIPSILSKTHGYICLPKRERVIALREEKASMTSDKWHSAHMMARVFSWIPTVMLVGVTGGLAMDNAHKADDIDLFFVAKPKTMWATRMIVTAVAELMRVRRRPHDDAVSNKVCLNMFMTEDSLSLPLSERDLFAAHEVLQMKPLWDRGGVHTKMLEANRWVSYFLPNAWKYIYKNSRKNAQLQRVGFFQIIGGMLIQIMEPFGKTAQLLYMKNKRTSEVIRSGMIRFHPRDARVWVYEKFQKRLKHYDIPIDKIFYHR